MLSADVFTKSAIKPLTWFFEKKKKKKKELVFICPSAHYILHYYFGFHKLEL